MSKQIIKVSKQINKVSRAIIKVSNAINRVFEMTSGYLIKINKDRLKIYRL